MHLPGDPPKRPLADPGVQWHASLSADQLVLQVTVNPVVPEGAVTSRVAGVTENKGTRQPATCNAFLNTPTSLQKTFYGRTDFAHKPGLV